MNWLNKWCKDSYN